ncbi:MULTISPECIES: molybdate ABC transporter substrate-binding protein [unclassified Saccharicrinis]|uniref:molybdate ABC transporter substrate-binding protein n=1 Tax=unclassified Saccharicrinis TaxID=2646859 RepID=UPI003D343FA2
MSVLFFVACDEVKNKSNKSASEHKKELTIYCENAMVPVLMELKEKFESGSGCTIKLHNDGSQNLSSLIQYTQKGDIYLPASKVGFKKLSSKNYNYIVDSVFIGYNTLVVMTVKGNPTGYDGDINSLVEKQHAIIIANPETSTLGYDTRKYLEEKKLYSDVILNVVALSTDSRGLVKSLKNEEAQLVLNWESDIYVNGNRDHVEVFNIPDFQQSPSEIYAGILSTSENPELAREFLDYATGEEAISIFRKYGFNRRKTLIF